ncbi:MAG TPA: OmpA family protein [Clostridia bacterium]|nr:OmpA family protein [Clostridia bacterium]
MLTYGDMVTLILTFFVFLFSVSAPNSQQFLLSVRSIRGALGFPPLPSAIGEEPLGEAGSESGDEELKKALAERLEREMAQLEEVKLLLAEFLEESLFGDTVRIEMDERGIVIRFAENVLFDLGKADLRPDARKILDEIAKVLAKIPNHIRVEGHTDNLPIATSKFPSNWELSTARATAVIRYMIDLHSIDPRRMSAAGYGEYRPLKPNDSDENRRLNRRVDIVILRLGLSEGEPLALPVGEGNAEGVEAGGSIHSDSGR